MKIFDGKFEYAMRWKSIQPACHLKIYQVGRQQDGTLIVVYSEIPGYDGVSVTNGAEKIATAIHAEPRPSGGNTGRYLFVEHWPVAARHAAKEDTFDVVTFAWHQDRQQVKEIASSPCWTRVNRAWLELLIGEKFDG